MCKESLIIEAFGRLIVDGRLIWSGREGCTRSRRVSESTCQRVDESTIKENRRVNEGASEAKRRDRTKLEPDH
jgi:hypothetical protein